MRNSTPCGNERAEDSLCRGEKTKEKAREKVKSKIRSSETEKICIGSGYT